MTCGRLAGAAGSYPSRDGDRQQQPGADTVAHPDVIVREPRVQVVPGEVVQAVATVHNPGAVVESYELEVVGVPGAWASVVPPLVPLMPDERQDVRVVFSPPPGRSAPVGEFAYGLRCRSTVDPTACAVAEGDVAVDALHGAQARLV